VGPRAGLDDVEKRKFLTLPGLELQPLGRQARSQSLYRLHYPGSLTIGSHANKLPTAIQYNAQRMSRHWYSSSSLVHSVKYANRSQDMICWCEGSNTASSLIFKCCLRVSRYTLPVTSCL
jgi:hypothetical protein